MHEIQAYISVLVMVATA